MIDPPRWHARYLAYRDLGPTRRLDAAYHASGGRQIEVPPLWLDAYQRYHWRERAEFYDQEQAAQQAAERQEMAERERAERQETDDHERAERVGLLKAARGKLVVALRDTEAQSDDFGRIVSQIATISEQLRKESEG